MPPDLGVEPVDVVGGHGFHEMTTQHWEHVLREHPAILGAGFLLRRVVAQEAFHEVGDCGRREAFETRLCRVFSVTDTGE